MWYKKSPILRDMFGKDVMHIDLDHLAKDLCSKPRRLHVWLCPHCDRTHKTRRLVIEHKFTAHGVPIIMCKVCGAYFDDKKELKAHEKEMVGGKCQLPCWEEGCGVQFNWDRDRFRHVENIHWNKMAMELKIRRYDIQAK